MIAEVSLANFLRKRRASLTLDTGDQTDKGMRRVPGLRREEVARMAGVSIDYYTRLEQGRRVSASDGVLEALADVLRLDQPARQHMLDLARRNSGRRKPHDVPPQQARPGMLRLMESLDGAPAVLLGRRTDILAATPTARLLFADFHAMPAHERNAIRWLLTSREAREICRDWEDAVTGLVGMLRMHAGRYPKDTRMGELVHELGTSSRDFIQIWDDCHVATRMVRESKTVDHPLVGRIRFRVEAVVCPEDPDQCLQVFIPAYDSVSDSGMRELKRLADAERLSA